MVTLKQTIDIMERLSMDYNVWFEGRGDGRIRLIVEEKDITIINTKEANQ